MLQFFFITYKYTRQNFKSLASHTLFAKGIVERGAAGDARDNDEDEDTETQNKTL